MQQICIIVVKSTVLHNCLNCKQQLCKIVNGATEFQKKPAQHIGSIEQNDL